MLAKRCSLSEAQGEVILTTLAIGESVFTQIKHAVNL